MNCPHLSVYQTGECSECGAQVASCPPEIVIARLGRCEHGRIDEQFGFAWCHDCGAIRHDMSDGWTLARFVVQAKDLDTYSQSIGCEPDEDEVDSEQENVIPTKTGT